MSKCLIIEGLPGSGKTTFSKRLEDALKLQGKNVKRFSEGDLHPLDLAWCALLNQTTYDQLCEKYQEVSDQIKTFTTKENDTYIVAYTQVALPNHYTTFLDDFGAYEIFRTNDLDTFKQAHIKRWKHFAKNINIDTVYIFECIFLQNHINELLLKYGPSKEEIIDYFNDLLDALDPINPHVFYIQQKNVRDRIGFIANQRKTNNRVLYKDWIDYVVEYFERQPLAKQKQYFGVEGVYQYMDDRQSIELSILPQLHTSYTVLHLDKDYNEVFNTLCQLIEHKKIA